MKILLYKGVSPVSKIIRWHTRSEYSHAAIMLSDGSVVEAWHKGVEHAKDFKQNHTPGTVVHVFGIKASIEQQNKAEQIFLKQVGREYDFSGVAGFLLREDTDIDDRLFCSESVMTGLNEADIHLLERIDPGKVSPRDISISPTIYFEEEWVV